MPMHQRTPLAERFWPKVNMTGDCWEWQGARDRAGYGRIQRGGRGEGTMLASRASYEMAYGPLPADALVCHRCDNPPCVRPTHLFIGSVSDNALDSVSKGRWHRLGVPPASRKLTDDQVREIRRLAELRVPHSQIADRYGVHKTTVKAVINRRSYAHVE
jgi:hypothetical protein